MSAGVKEAFRAPGAGVRGGGSHTNVVCWKLNSGSLQVQQVHLGTEPSLQSLIENLKLVVFLPPRPE